MKSEEDESRQNKTFRVNPELEEAVSIARLRIKAQQGKKPSFSDIADWALREWLERNFPSAGGENVLQSSPLDSKQRQLLSEIQDFLANGEKGRVRNLTNIIKLLLAREREDAQG